MADVRWDENLPSGGSAIKLGDDDIRSIVTSLRVGLGSEHSWPSTTQVEDRGRHTPNASRVSYGSAKAGIPLATALSSGMSGFMYLDTSGYDVMFAYPSTASVPVGGARTVHSDIAYTAGSYFIISAFTTASGSSASYGDNSITFNAIPTVSLTGVAPDGSGMQASVENIAAHEILIKSHTAAGVASSGDTIHVLAMGLADFGEGP